MSHISHEEEKRSIKSETSSQKSAPRSTTSSIKGSITSKGRDKVSKVDKLA